MRGCSVRKGNKKRPAAGAGLVEVTLLYGLRTGRSGSGFVRGAMTASRTFTVKIKVRANPLALTRRFRYVVWRWGAGHRRRGVTIGDLNDRRSRDNRLSRNDRLRRWCRFNHRFRKQQALPQQSPPPLQPQQVQRPQLPVRQPLAQRRQRLLRQLLRPRLHRLRQSAAAVHQPGRR
ncbi:Uncharacterised protein [Klebsiella michiganensis]|uniref:Uncharacterized protein n=1 Tax=Klebsiella michiganensis TaxID=1134687 RepID=A0A7H4N1I7_9ENTR|nr:Uncharacterised protein [Klebsiella michiganensis]